MWTKETRRRHDRSHLRYASDLTDEEWAEVAAMIPPAKPGARRLKGCAPRTREAGFGP